MAARWVYLGAEVSRAIAELQPGETVPIGGGRTGRMIVVVRQHDTTLSCLDYHCFHHGGQLGAGEVVDIEDVGSALVCPEHGYLVHCATGTWLRRDTDDTARCTAHGQVQRVHPLEVGADGMVRVQIEDSPTSRISSDTYNLPCVEQAAKAAASRTPRRSAGPSFSQGQIAFAARRRAAVDAVKTACASAGHRRAGGLGAPAAQGATVGRLPGLRQTQLEGFFPALHSPSSDPGGAERGDEGEAWAAGSEPGGTEPMDMS